LERQGSFECQGEMIDQCEGWTTRRGEGGETGSNVFRCIRSYALFIVRLLGLGLAHQEEEEEGEREGKGDRRRGRGSKRVPSESARAINARYARGEGATSFHRLRSLARLI